MGERPGQLRVTAQGKISLSGHDQLLRIEGVLPQKVVGLVEPVLPQQRRFGLALERRVLDRPERGEVRVVQGSLLPERVGEAQEVVVGLLTHSDDELRGGPSGRRTARRTRIVGHRRGPAVRDALRTSSAE